MNRLILTAVICALIFFSAETVLAQNSARLEKHFSLLKTENIKMNVADVNVFVSSSNSDIVLVYATGFENNSNPELKAFVADGSLLIQTSKNSLENNSLAKSIEVFIPKDKTLEICLTGGSLDVFEINGSIELNTINTDVSINNSNCNIKAILINGILTIAKTNGTLDAYSALGDMKIDMKGKMKLVSEVGNIAANANSGEVEITVKHGDISLSYDGENKGINLATIKGNVTLNIPDKTKCDLAAYTTDGKMSIIGKDKAELSHAVNSDNQKLNGGGNMIKCSTIRGDISIAKQ